MLNLSQAVVQLTEQFVRSWLVGPDGFDLFAPFGCQAETHLPAVGRANAPGDETFAFHVGEYA